MSITAAPIHAQSVSGRLLDRESGQPITSATVRLLAADSNQVRRTITNASGAFSLNASSAGRYILIAERIGYATASTAEFEIGWEDRVVMELRMSQEAVELEGVVAVVEQPRRPGELGGFYHRRRTRMFGVFLTREDFDGYATRFSDILWQNNLMGRPTLCVNYFLNGSPFRGLDTGPNGLDNGMDALIDPTHIEAIEIYRSMMDVPPEYRAQSSGDCGAVLIWTPYALDDAMMRLRGQR